MLWAVSVRPYGVDEAMPLNAIRLAESRNALRSAAVPVRVRLAVPDPPTVTPLPVVDVSVGAGDGEAGPPVTESTTVSVSIPLPTAFANRISPLEDRTVKLAGRDTVGDTMGADAMPAWISTLPVPCALTAVPSATAVPSPSVMVPEVVLRTIEPFAPVVRISLWGASVLFVVKVVASVFTRFTDRPTSPITRSFASSSQMPPAAARALSVPVVISR